METLKNLYCIGNGPSSSHTMGPSIAATIFKNKHLDINDFEVILYGSLAISGKGHLTDVAIKKVLGENTKIIFDIETNFDYHPNGMKFKCFKDNKLVDEWLVFSVGGGQLKELNEDRSVSRQDIYPHNTTKEILDYCLSNGLTFKDYVLKYESKDILEYMNKVLDTMFECVEKGLVATSILPGSLNLQRRANTFYKNYLENKDINSLIFASSLAVAEQNASGDIVVTAPTCGSSGIVPGVLYTYYKFYKTSKEKLIDALLVGGLIGNIIKTTGSISGAEVGCQGEVGVACAMASAAIAYLSNGSLKQIEYAAEIALEHHFGLTCDPIKSYVQIPCIERNAISCKRAFDASYFALQTNGDHYVKLDDAIKTMVETGKDLKPSYKETGLGGLAKQHIC